MSYSPKYKIDISEKEEIQLLRKELAETKLDLEAWRIICVKRYDSRYKAFEHANETIASIKRRKQ